MTLNRLWYVILGVPDAILFIRPYLTPDLTVAAEASKGTHDPLSGFSPGRTNDTKESGCDIHLTEGVWVTTPGKLEPRHEREGYSPEPLYLRPNGGREGSAYPSQFIKSKANAELSTASVYANSPCWSHCSVTTETKGARPRHRQQIQLQQNEVDWAHIGQRISQKDRRLEEVTLGDQS
jgi:hypothetical protein